MEVSVMAIFHLNNTVQDDSQAASMGIISLKAEKIYNVGQ